MKNVSSIVLTLRFKMNLRPTNVNMRVNISVHKTPKVFTQHVTRRVKSHVT